MIIRTIFIIAAVITIIGIIIYRSLAAIPFAFGVLATSGLNVFLYRKIERTVQKVLQMDDPAAGKNIVTFHSLLRFFLTGVVLAVIGLIHNFTTPPPIYDPDRLYIAVWASIFPNAPEALLTAPLISIWGALFGIFTLKLSVKAVSLIKREKDGEHFVKYEDDEEDVCDDDGEENTVISDVSDVGDETVEKTGQENTTEQNVDY